MNVPPPPAVDRAPSEWFASWFDTEAYHALYGHRSEPEAQGFIAALFDAGHLHAGTAITDMACGKGRHTRALAACGASPVTGLDLSPRSILAAQALAAAEPDSPLTYRVHDMRLPLPVAHQGAILNLFTSFGYFDNPAVNRQVLGHVVEALQPGGVFVLDFLNLPRVLSTLVPAEVQDRPEAGLRFDIRREYVPDATASPGQPSGHILKHIDVVDMAGINPTATFTEQVQALSPDTLRALVGDVGFDIVREYGDYALGLYTSDSPRIILVCRKPE